MTIRRGGAIAALLVLVAAIGLSPAAAGAEDGTTVREAVVSTLGSDGEVVATQVSQLIQMDAPPGGRAELRVPKTVELDSYRNLSGFTGPSGEGEDLVWRTSSRLDASALAKTRQELPIDVRIAYSLNGKRVDAEEIKGKAGDVRIEIELENVSGDPATLEHEGVTSPLMTSTVNRYVPVEYLVRADFPTTQWRGVQGPDVHVQPAGTELLVASASGIIAPPSTPSRVTVVFEATTDDALLPRIQMFANARASQEYLDALQTQFEALQALYGGLGDLGDTLTKIYDGTTELVGGVDDMLGGVGTRDERTGEPDVVLDRNGDPTTLLGAIGLIGDGVSGHILPAIGERDPESGEGVVEKDEKGNTTTLIGGLQSQKDAYDDELIPGVEDAIDGIDEFKGLVEDGGDEIADGIDEFQSQVSGGGEELAGGIDDFQSLVSDGGGELVAGLEQLQAGVMQVFTGLDTEFKGGLEDLLTGLGDRNVAPVGIDGVTGLPCGTPGVGTCVPADVISALTVMKAGVDQLVAGLGNKNDAVPNPATVIGGLRLMDAGVDTIVGGLEDVIDSLQTIRSTLVGLQATAAAGGVNCANAACVTDFATIAGTLSAVIAGFGDEGDAVPDENTVIGALRLLSGGLDANVGDNLTALIGSLQTDSPGTPGFREGLLGISGGLSSLLGSLQTNDLGDPGFREGLVLLLAGLGDASDPPTDATVIGALQLIFGGLDLAAAGGDELVSGVLGGLDELGTGGGELVAGVLGGLDELGAGTGELVDGVLGGLDQIRAGFTNPEFTREQDALEGRTPKEYYQDCPACFDPTSDRFDEDTDDPDFQPALLEVFTLFSEGIRDALPELQSFDPDDPGLVEGLEQIVDGLDEMAKGLHTFDPDDPGLVDGLQLVQGGLQQVSQGLFATNELGVRTTRGQVGDQGDTIGRDRATIEAGSKAAATTGALGETANVATTYVFDLPAQSTGTRDNLVRGALMSLLAAGLGLLWFRPRIAG